MKNFYIFSIVALAFSFNLNAQILFEDDFESYTPGPMGDQAPWWTTWSGVTGTGEDILVGGGVNQRGYIGPGGIQDALLLLGNQEYGLFHLRFYIYVPSGANGYWNIQQEETPGIQWNGQWYVDATIFGGSPGVITYDITGATIPYPNNQWFEILYEIDLDFLTISMWVDNNLFLDSEPYQGTWLGAMNFFSIDSNTDFWIDDIYYIDGIFAVDDFSADVFSVYPNPVQDILNISSKAAVDVITVYDILGKIILQAQPDVISPSINMSALQSGAYLVNVTIGNVSKTVKIIK